MNRPKDLPAQIQAVEACLARLRAQIAAHPELERDLATSLSEVEQNLGQLEHAAQQAAWEAERFTLLAEAAHDMIFVIDRDDRVAYVNRFAAGQFGRTPEELIGRPRSELFPGDIAVMQRRHLDQVMQSGESAYFEEVCCFPAGDVFLGTWLTPLRDRHGEIIAVQGVSRDLTDRRQMEIELANSQKRFERLFQASPVAMALRTLQEGWFLDVNQAFCELTEFPRSELLGKDWHTLRFWPDDAERDRMERLLAREGAVHNFEIQLRTRTGRIRHVLASLEQVEIGAEQCCIFIALDITHRKELRARLHRMQRLQSVATLVGGVAHHFSNLLTVMRGHAELLRQEPGLSERAAQSLDRLIEAADAAGRLTRQMLAFSRRQPMRPRPLQLNDIVLEVSSMLDRLIGEQVELECSLSPNLPLVEADHSLLEQVLVNVANNAREAMPAGGKLRLHTGCEHIDDEAAATRPGARAGDFVVLSVEDTGCGIPREALPRIFEPFFTTHPSGRSTGLGLAAVHGIVAQHNGWVEVDSTVGQGTTFRIYLPTARQSYPTVAAEPLAPLHETPVGHETVLVVEDDPEVRDLTCSILERQGYRVHHADSLAAAEAVWRQHKGQIDLLLTDVVLRQGGTGYQLAERCLQQRPGLPVIFMTGYDSEAVPGKEQWTNRALFLAKPFSPRTLAEAVRCSLDEATDASGAST